MTVVRVLLADDHPILVEGLRDLHRRAEVVSYALGHGLMDAG